MKKFRLFIVGTIVLSLFIMFISGITFARGRATNPAGKESDVLVKYEIARNKCNIARYQWYDFYVEGEKFQRLTIKKDGAKSIAIVEGNGDGVSFKTEWHTNFAYWYNQNQGPAIGYPETGFTGTEEVGNATGTITVDGHTANLTNAAGEIENLCDGAIPGVTQKVDYRKQMTIYGNEWWISLHADQIDGQIIIIGPFRDAAFFINGEYIVPSEVKITPIVANKSLMINAKTSKGEFVASANVMAWESMFYEYGGPMEGSIGGKQFTNGHMWIEHTPIGGVDGVALEDAGKQSFGDKK